MAQVDFAIAFVVVFTMITYSIFVVSSTITKDFDYFNDSNSQGSAFNKLIKNNYTFKKIN